MVVKRDASREAFARAKVARGVRAAAKGRPLPAEIAEEVACGVEDALRVEGHAEVGSAEVGRAVLERLRELDAVTAVRFASVYKAFEDLADFEREVTLLAGRVDPPSSGG